MISFSEDTPLGEVKVGELPAWLSRRSKNPVDWGRAVSRAYWRWSHKYYLPKYCGITPVVQLCVGLSAFFYFLNYPRISEFGTSLLAFSLLGIVWSA